MSDEKKDSTQEEQKTDKTQKGKDVSADRLKDLEKQLKKEQQEKEQLQMKLKSLDRAPQQESEEVIAVVENLKQKIDELERRQPVVQTVDGKKPKYKPKDPKDLLPPEDAVTFTARSVMKIIPGYLDASGLEVLAPHSLIVFNFAASDRRMDGKEEDIINFCSFTTRWKTEIDFLRGHPEYNVTFGENMNKVAGQNPREYQFRVKASQEVQGMSVESLLGFAEQYKIPNYRSKAPKDLKPLVLDAIVADHVEQEKVLNNKILSSIAEQSEKFK